MLEMDSELVRTAIAIIFYCFVHFECMVDLLLSLLFRDRLCWQTFIQIPWFLQNITKKMPKVVLILQHVTEDCLSIYNIFVNITTVDLFACTTS